MQTRAVALLFLVSLLFVSAASHNFSRQTRNDDLSYLERLTLPFRRKTRMTGRVAENLIDFLASRRGLLFLAGHIETLWYQELLELQYGRRFLCKNVQNAEKRKKGLSAEERRLKNCLCRFYMPFLHCLAIGGQLLRETGSLNGEPLNIALTQEVLANEGQPFDSSAVPVSRVQNLAEEEEEESPVECIPKFYAEGEVYYGGHCTVPIASLLKIELDHKASTGFEKLLFFDAPRCAICSGMDGRDCQPVCKDNILMVESLVDNASAKLASKVCLDLRQVGDIFATIFGVDGCFSEINVELFFYQRVLDLQFHAGLSNWRVISELRHKFDDGPPCTCQLRTFRCTDPCRMKKNALVGVIGIEWDLFFGSGSWVREFNEKDDCYTDHIHLPADCPDGTAPVVAS